MKRIVYGMGGGTLGRPDRIGRDGDGELQKVLGRSHVMERRVLFVGAIEYNRWLVLSVVDIVAEQQGCTVCID